MDSVLECKLTSILTRAFEQIFLIYVPSFPSRCCWTAQRKTLRVRKNLYMSWNFQFFFCKIWGWCHQSKRKADLSMINHKHNGTSVKVIRNSTNRALKNVKVVTGKPKTKRRARWQSMKVKSKGIRSYSSDPLLGAHSVIHLNYLRQMDSYWKRVWATAISRLGELYSVTEERERS